MARFKRILLKLSGESLMGKQGYGMWTLGLTEGFRPCKGRPDGYVRHSYQLAGT